MDRGAWWAAVHGVTKSQTQLSDQKIFHLEESPKGKQYLNSKMLHVGNSLAVQWSGLRAFTVVALGSMPSWGIKILQASW